MRYNVTATSLNLRNGASLTSAIICSLPNGQVVDSIDSNDTSNSDWLKISAIVNGNSLVGYVASRYLREIPATVPAGQKNPHNVPEVNYASSPDSRRDSITARHEPLGEANMPQRNVGSGATPATKIADIYKIVDYLDVVNSARYQPTSKTTYCNIYTYDFCYLAQAYLPRVWWMSKTLMEFAKTPEGSQPVAPTHAYGKNVAELNANALYDWLDEWGDDFGWVRTYDLTDQQSKVNDGRVGVICAKRIDLTRSGHITCVLPEANGMSARRNGVTVTAPLQSQAGMKNKKFFSDDWWVRLAQEYSNCGYWYHD